MADVQQFPAIDAAKWQRIKDAARAKIGVVLAADIGDASAKGIELSWSYNAQTLDLTVTLVKRSWFDPNAAEIDTDIATWIGAA